MTKDPYKDKLSDDAYRVCRLAATEQPFSGKYNDHWLDGVYHCVCCDQPLFQSSKKFDAGCGWPSFYQAIEGNVNYLPDHSHNMVRTEIECLQCNSHLGHVFDDGPKPTGKRYCVNSLSLTFVAK
ncbi:peptide-methionine (R)-S-oxide reductase MsrB [Thalassotalea piscium]|uniref:Peptide methionine sulfoxide reductase MsrB n=1 Tax=Thalassotalea piscium TaxID=1230533 RepID=A0A7X0TSN4_9GAMM|nr:peptide-methionine (R)-S-oxide reductase MsrB [Thalassotalea piscium]MBB6542311.1 peptide-methionine (R)-S-oxide reductase [Thalassotalea piscium]